MPAGHRSVYGSFFGPEGWGYACCRRSGKAAEHCVELADAAHQGVEAPQVRETSFMSHLKTFKAFWKPTQEPRRVEMLAHVVCDTAR